YSSLAAAQNERCGHPMQLTVSNPFRIKRSPRFPESICIPARFKTRTSRLLPGSVRAICCSSIPAICSESEPTSRSSTYKYLRSIPRVITHIHDVPFPNNFPCPTEFWIFGQTWPILWNEAMLLQAFLAFNREFEIIMSFPLIRYHDEAFLRANI